jgi:hypothetical protein
LRRQATSIIWTVKRLCQSVRRLVVEGLVDRKVMGRATRLRRRRTEELAILVQGIALANPGLSLRGIGGQLEAMKIRTRGWEAELDPDLYCAFAQEGPRCSKPISKAVHRPRPGLDVYAPVNASLVLSA